MVKKEDRAISTASVASTASSLDPANNKYSLANDLKNRFKDLIKKKQDAGEKIDAYQKNQLRNALDKVKVSFAGDIYTMTALAFYKEKSAQLKLNANINAQRVFFLFLMFIVQNGLLLFMTLEIIDL